MDNLDIPAEEYETLAPRFNPTGFDAAEWIVPEVRTGLESAPAAAGPASSPAEMA